MLLFYLSLIDDTSDRAKFEMIYLEYRQIMWSEANKILHDPIEAEDIVHIAFMEILKNLQTIHDPICPQTRNFVVIISRSRAINLYKKRKRENEISFDTVADYNLENHILSGSLADEIELKEKALLLNKLPVHYRDILYLRYNLGYSVNEAASLLGISKDNAKKRITRAKTQLAQLIDGWNLNE